MLFENLLQELKGTSKPAAKQVILRSYDGNELRTILKATYDPFVLFNVNIKPKEIPDPSNHDLGEIFDELEAVLRFCKNSKSAKQNREMVISLLEKLNKGSQDLVVGILNKNWKVGLGTRNMLKVFPGLVKQFIVQLANTYDPEKHKLGDRILSYKLDGIRCVAIRESSDEHYDKGRWTLYSRQGKKFLTVDHLKPQLERLYMDFGWTFLDGELYKHGLTFEEIQGPVMAFTRGQVPGMEYHVFIAGDAEKFLAGKEPNHVEVPYGSPTEYAPHVNFVNIGVIGVEDIEEQLEAAFEKGYEGIMLRDPDELYDYKRSNALLKLKRRLGTDSEAEGEVISDCVILSIEYNDFFPVIEDKKLHTERLLNKLWVEQEDGIKCKVGSGYSLKFRREHTENPLSLIGKKAEVKHQGWGANGRMRFPRLYRIREDL